MLFILIESDCFLPIVQQQTDILVDLRASQIQFHKRKKLDFICIEVIFVSHFCRILRILLRGNMYNIKATCLLQLYRGHPKKAVNKQVYNFRGKKQRYNCYFNFSCDCIQENSGGDNTKCPLQLTGCSTSG